MRSAILHIGTEKTGTTAIQAMLTSRRSDLARLGFWYPSSPGKYSHTALAIYAAPENTVDLVEHLPVGNFNEAEFVRSLAREIAALPAHIRTVIFSNEHCQSRLITIEHVAKLHALLSPYFSTITIVVYLRRQDKMASSLYSTRLRGGEPALNILSGLDLNELFWASYFNYEGLLDRYEHVFGAAFLKPRIYEPEALRNGDVVHDFLGICGLSLSLAEGTAAVNRTIAADGQKFLLALNGWQADSEHSRNRDLAKTIRETCALIVEKRLQGQPIQLARNDARRFYETFRESNNKTRDKWFPERSRLFEEDFSQYPKRTDTAANTNEAALRAAFVIIEDLIRQNNETSAALHPRRRWFQVFIPRRLWGFLRALLGQFSL